MFRQYVTGHQSSNHEAFSCNGSNTADNRDLEMIRSSVNSQEDVDDLLHFSRKWAPDSWKSFDASENSFDPDEVDGPEEGDVQRNRKREACRLDARLGFGDPFDPDDPNLDADCLDPDHHDLELSAPTDQMQGRVGNLNHRQGSNERVSPAKHNLPRYDSPHPPHHLPALSPPDPHALARAGRPSRARSPSSSPSIATGSPPSTTTRTVGRDEIAGRQRAGPHPATHVPRPAAPPRPRSPPRRATRRLCRRVSSTCSPARRRTTVPRRGPRASASPPSPRSSASPSPACRSARPRSRAGRPGTPSRMPSRIRVGFRV